jgi:hypothetical protein
MPRRTLLNLALLAAAAAVAAALWLLPGEVQQTPAPPLVPGADVAAIDEIRVLRPGGVDLRFYRRGSTWSMTQPVAAPAHRARINALLGLLADQSLARLPVAGLDLSQFGLDRPAVSVELGPHRIEFGDPHPMDEQRYVRLGDTVHLVPDSLYVQLTQNAGFFIDNRLLPSGARPTRIRYPAFSLESGAAGWREQPPAERSTEELRLVAGAWQTARALAVRTPAAAGNGHGAIAVETGAGSPIVFEIATLDPTPILVRRDLDIQYHLDARTAEQLLIAPAAMTPPPD